MANPQLKHKPSSLEIKINPDCKPVPNGALARLSRTQKNGEPATLFWYAEVDCCIYLPNSSLIPAPPPILELDAGSYSIIYSLNPDYTNPTIRYKVRCERPCPEVSVDNGESIIIDA
jgi:hypothetical protein